MATEGYGSHHDYMSRVKADADTRQATIEAAIRKAFAGFIEKRKVEIIAFGSMSALDLAKALLAQPLILKPLLVCCNIAARAVERDLQIRNLNTYVPHLNEGHAKVIAGYIKPFLPPYVEVPSMSLIDRVSYVDKEVRKGKGRWERLVLEAINHYAETPFRKRKFEASGQKFELDLATPGSGPIRAGIDVKRIEARRDIHKRCDEIVNKANKLKSVFPAARFGAFIYYPFLDEHINVQSRLGSAEIDAVVFASESKESIEDAVRMLLSTLRIRA